VPLSCLASHLAVAADPPSAITDIGTLDAENVAKPFKSKQTYSPAAAWNYPQRVYWGDTHLHISASMMPARSENLNGLRAGRPIPGIRAPYGPDPAVAIAPRRATAVETSLNTALEAAIPCPSD
jgi:hypothetical protein